MKRDIVTIVAAQLKSAQRGHAFAMHEAENAEDVFDAKTHLLKLAGERLIDIEEIYEIIAPN